MNILAPDLPATLDAEIDLLDKLSGDERVEEGAFSGESYAGENLKGLDAVRCRFTKCDFSQAKLEQSGFRDVVFDACDFSNCDFAKAAFQRVVFQNCKLMGADFVEGSMRHMHFTDCGARYANFSDSKLQDTAFESSRLENAAFVRCKLAASFSQCNLSQALFEQTPMKGFDLRTCRLDGIQVTLNDLKGAIVTPLQAADLAALLGLVIKEPEE